MKLILIQFNFRSKGAATYSKLKQFKGFDIAREELHDAATAYYTNASRELRDREWNFFCSMDVNGDDRVSLVEFVEFFRQCGYQWIDHDMFIALDRNGDGSLDFWEVLTLYYIMKTRGVRCGDCGVCLMGLYFTCVACFDSGGNTYDLCATCYSEGRFQHRHACFLDSYVLLRSRRGIPAGEANMNLALVPRPAVAPNAPPRVDWWGAFHALERAVNVANLLVN